MILQINPPKSFIDAFWNNGIAPELITFLHSLNWFYIIMFINILYGLKYTGQFTWYDKILSNSKLGKYKIWITAFVLAFTYICFRWADPTLNINVEYISSLCRSICVSVIFSGIFVDIPALIIIKIRNFLESDIKTIDSKSEK